MPDSNFRRLSGLVYVLRLLPHFRIHHLLLVFPVMVTYRNNSGTIYSSTFLPGRHSALYPSPASYVRGATLNSLSSLTTGVTASFYLFQNKPALTKDNFTLSLTHTESLVSVHVGSYKYLNFHLYPGTKYSLRACLSAGSSSITYLVIKGTSAFNELGRLSKL